MVTETGCLLGNAGTTGKNSTEYREYICSVADLSLAVKFESLSNVCFTVRVVYYTDKRQTVTS